MGTDNIAPNIDTFWGRCAPEVVAARSFPSPHWRANNTCSHCGGLRPSLALLAIQGGAKVTPTDKNYKMYLELPNPEVGKLRIIGSRNFESGRDDGFQKVTPELIAAHPHIDFRHHMNDWVQLSPHTATRTAKVYFNHFSESQAVELVRLWLSGKINFEYPGSFYSGLCFREYKAAIDAMTAAEFPPKPPEA